MQFNADQIKEFTALENMMTQCSQYLDLDHLRVEVQFQGNPEVLCYEEEDCTRSFNNDPSRRILQHFKDEVQGREHLVAAWRIRAVLSGIDHEYTGGTPVDPHEHTPKKKSKKHKEEPKEEAPEPPSEPALEQSGE